MNPVFLLTFAEVVMLLIAVMFWALFLWAFICAFSDIFRRRDLSGMGKAGWVLLIVVLPLVGVLIYFATRPKYHDTDLAVPWAPNESTWRSPADELAYAQQLLAQGTITQAEFEDIKRHVVGP